MKPDNLGGPLGPAGKLTRLFLRNREISLLTIIVIAVWGVTSFFLMPKQYNPEIVAPAFMVVTEFPGASVDDVYEQVTRPLEDKVSELPGLDGISSRSLPEGRSMVMVKFLVGTDRETAKTALNQKLRDGMPQKPAGVTDPTVQSIDPDDVPILDIGLSAADLSESSLRKVGIDVADRLKLVKGVAGVSVLGGRRNDLWVRIDAAALSARDMTLGEVTHAIATADGPEIRDALSSPERNTVLSVSESVTGPDDLAGIVVRKEGDAIVRLADVATVTYGPDDTDSFVRDTDRGAERTPIVHIAVSKLRGANATEVSGAVRSALAGLGRSVVPDGASVTVLNDEGAIAGEEITKLTFDLTKSIVIVGALLLVFLGARNAVIASISIPLVLLAVFGAGLLAGETVNRITLFALILSLGLLVDDAIVVVENIARYFRLYPGENRMRLIIHAVDEVGGALALSTLTMALAFLPMAFVTGMMGPYMGPIPFFVPAALAASLLFSVTINPFLAHLLAPTGAHAAERPSYESGSFYRVVKRIEVAYAAFLTVLLSVPKRRAWFLGSVAAAFLVSIVLPMTPLVPFRMLPKADKDHFSVYLDLPETTAARTTDAVTRDIEVLLLHHAEVLGVESFVGTAPVTDFNGLFKGSTGRVAGNQATLRVRLTTAGERHVTSEEIASAVRSDLGKFASLHPDADVRIMEDPPGPPVLSTLLVKVKGPDGAVRDDIVRDMERTVRGTAGVVDIATSLPEHSIGRSYRIDREKSGRLGIDTADIAAAIRTAFSGISAGSYRSSSMNGPRTAEEERIMVRFADDFRDDIRTLPLVRLSGTDGRTVPLSELLIADDRPTETEIGSDDREPVGTVSGEMEGRSVVYAAIDLLRGLHSYTLPDGSGTIVSRSLLGAEFEDTKTHDRYRIELGGEWKLTIEVFRDLGIAMALAVFLIYFVLAAKTASLAVPLIIMISIPLSLIGVMPGFAALHAMKGTYFNATSMIGVIALAGLAVKNAVIYLEYLEPLKRAGKSIEEALVEAGRVRLLPITLTSLAAILGSFTIVSDPVWEGLAWAIIFGLTASTFLTLIVFPLTYYLAKRRSWHHAGDGEDENHPD